MLKNRSFFVLLAVSCVCLPAAAQRLATEAPIAPAMYANAPAKAEPLVSPSVAQRFHEIAAEIADSNDITGPEVEQAMIFLTAAQSLDNTAAYVLPLLIRLGCRHPNMDYSQQVYRWLAVYTDEYADLEVIKEGISYLLDQANTRERRELLAAQMLKDFGGKNAVVASDLATMLGLLMAERGDVQSAQFYLIQAYTKNKYNKLAFAKLAELVPQRISPAAYLEHLRLVLRENPVNIDAALALAQYAEQLQLYDLAAGTYDYCADLFGYLYPGTALPPRIYLPWAVSSYNTRQNKHKCLQIAESIRLDGRFDILLESIAGRAAAKTGDPNKASRIFQAAEQKAQEFLEQGPKRNQVPSESATQNDRQRVGAKQFAWFYCFASVDSIKALDWANKAYSTDPNSAAAAALLAYALVMNRQIEWAKPLLESYERTQIADVALAQIQLEQGQKEAAIETLKSAVGKDPGSLAAERAKEILAEQGVVYVPPVDPNAILAALANSLGSTLTPKFISPEKMFSAQLNIRGNEFPYGSEFGGTISIVNNSGEPLVVSDDGLFKGNIRIDADVTGDLTKNIPNLISRRIRTGMVLEPGQGMVTSMRLVTGELGQIVLTYPQASLDIEFTLYLDPVSTEQGKVTNRLVDLEPVTARVKRPGIELSSQYLRSRFNAISMGQPGQKIKTAQLFVGLLKEQHAMAEQGALYKFKYADWMPVFLKSALLQESGLLLNPAETDWPVKIHTMAEMLSLPLDHELMSAAAKNLMDAKWPVRMMAVYLLAKSPDGGFRRVLSWAAEYDTDRLVRDMAIALSAAGRTSTSSESANLAEPRRLAEAAAG